MKAKFKTAYLQKETVLDVKVKENVEVGTLVKFDTDGVTLTSAGVTSVAAADYIIAQSDMTMEYGHVPVEDRNYVYSPAVKASTTLKKVAVFVITDENDIVAYNA